MSNDLDILYEDNHFIAVNKTGNDLVQGDRTGDSTLADKVKEFIKQRDNKPGNVFLGVIHRVDRPTSGIVLYAKTSKGLSRMSELFRSRDVEKIYWAIVDRRPPESRGELIHYLKKNGKQNKSYPCKEETPGGKQARLRYRVAGESDRYVYVEIELLTGRHHQIRAQFCALGVHIKGDLKYGAKRSNPDGGISLHAREIRFMHPITGERVTIIAPPPKDVLWAQFPADNSLDNHPGSEENGRLKGR